MSRGLGRLQRQALDAVAELEEEIRQKKRYSRPKAADVSYRIHERRITTPSQVGSVRRALQSLVARGLLVYEHCTYWLPETYEVWLNRPAGKSLEEYVAAELAMRRR